MKEKNKSLPEQVLLLPLYPYLEQDASEAFRYWKKSTAEVGQFFLFMNLCSKQFHVTYLARSSSWVQARRGVGVAVGIV